MLRREQRGHASDEGIATRLSETHWQQSRMSACLPDFVIGQPSQMLDAHTVDVIPECLDFGDQAFRFSSSLIFTA
jgi:hypothetical protein